MQRSLLAALTVLVPLAAPAAGGPESRAAQYPYYPTLLEWEASGAEFTDPEVCGGCHPRQFEEWSGSMHAMAFRDPVYEGELNKAVQAIGHENARNCEGCHSPAGVISGEIQGAGLEGLGPVALAGVSCDICHSVVRVTHQDTPSGGPENASLVLSAGRDSAEGPVVAKRGPFPPSGHCGGGFHECGESPLHLTSELCAACHQSTHYLAHSPLGSTYLEWKRSPYAQRGVQCQDCHMVDLATFTRVADGFEKPRRDEYRHTFNGANFLLYSLGRAAAERAGDTQRAAAFRSQYEMAVERLRICADLEVQPIYRGGRLAEVRVRVHNRRVGHDLPTHLSSIRQMWLEVVATDADGVVLMASGRIQPDGELEPHTRLFGTEGQDEQFRPAVDPWAVRALIRNDTIPPRGYRDVYFGVPGAPDDGTVQLSVRLRYRQAPQWLAEDILGSVPGDIDLARTYGLSTVPALPVVDMATRIVTLASIR